jgi:hypothetical protein
VTAGLLLAGCSQTATGHGTTTTTSSTPTGSTTAKAPLTSSQMAAIVAATITTNNKANASLDLRLLQSYESGSALAIDSASYKESAALPNSSCLYPPFGIKVLQSVVAHGTSYPQSFVVLGSTYTMTLPKGCSAATTSCPNADSIFEFERTAPGAAWKIVFEPAADTGDIVHLAATGDATTPLAPASAATAAALPQALVTDLQHYEATGSRGPLKASYFNGTCWLVPDPRAAFEQYSRSGVNASQSYTPAAGQVSVPVGDKGVLTMFALDFETTLQPSAAGGTIDWVSDPSAEPVTGLLATGQYKRVVEHGALQIAAVTGGPQFTIVGAYSGVTSITGTLGSPGPGSTTGGGVLVSYVVR